MDASLSDEQRALVPVTRRSAAVVAVLAATAGVFSVVVSVVVPALPGLAVHLGTTRTSITWLVTAYLVAAAVATPLVGRAGDVWGKRRVLVGVLCVVAVGGALAAAADTLPWTVAGRVLQGVGGGVLPLAFGLLRDTAPRTSLPAAVGVVSAAVALGAGVGQALAGTLVRRLGVESVFWAPSVAVLLLALVCLLLPPGRPPSRDALPLTSALLMSGWLVSLVLGISRGPQWGWVSGPVLGLLLLFVAALAGWAWVEHRSPSPVVDLRVLRLPVVWRTNVVAFLLGMSMYALFAFLPQYVQAPRSAGYGWGASITASGALVAPATGAMFLGGLLTGPLTRRLGSRALLVGGSGVAVPAYLAVAWDTTSLGLLVAATALVGLGIGLVFSTTAALVVTVVPPDRSGVASGMTANIRVIGGAVGVAVFASVLASSGSAGGLPTALGYRTAFVVLAVASAVAAAVATLVPGRPSAGTAAS